MEITCELLPFGRGLPIDRVKYNVDIPDNMNKVNKGVRIMIDRELANELKKMMDVGDTYTTVIRRLLEVWKSQKQ